MLLSTQSAHGYTGTAVQAVSSTEVAWLCSNSILLRCVETGNRRVLKGAGRGISCFAVNRAAGLLAYAEKAFKSHLHVHDLASLRPLATLGDAPNAVFTDLAFSADGARLAACTDEPGCCLTVWAWEQGVKVAQHALSAPATSMSFSPANLDRLCTISNGAATIWSLQRLWTKYDMRPHLISHKSTHISCHTWCNQGLCLGCSDGQLLVIDNAQVDTPAECQSITQHNLPEAGGATSMASCASHLLVAGASPQVHLLQLPSETETSLQLVAAWSVETGATVQASSFVSTAAGHILEAAVGTTDGAVHLLSFNTATTPVQVASTALEEFHSGAINSAATHPDHCRVVTCGKDGTVRVWLPQQEGTLELEAMRRFSSPQTCVASCSGRALLAAGSETGAIRIIGLDKPASLDVVARQRLHKGAVCGLAFSPDGTVLASAGRDGSITFVSVPVDGAPPKVLGWYQSAELVSDVCWPKLPTSAEPAVLVNLAAGGILSIVPPTPSTPAAAPDMQISAREAQAKILRLETILFHIVVDATEGPAVVYGLGADKCVHKVVLPSDAAAWAGMRGRAHRSAARAQGHQKPSGHLALALGSADVITASADGSLAVWSKNLALIMEPGSSDTYHDTMSGGASAVAVGCCGTVVVSGGCNGSLFCHQLEGAGLVKPVELAPSGAGDIPTKLDDQDSLDSTEELLVWEQPVAGPSTVAESTVDVSEESQKTAQRLKQIARIVAKIVADNENAPPRERLERNELIVDVALMGELKAHGELHVSTVRESILAENAKMEIMAARIKNTCWDAMQTKGAFLTSMKSGMTVNNYALLPADTAAFQKAKMLRLVEVQEAASFRGLGDANVLRSTGAHALGQEEGDDAASPDSPLVSIDTQNLDSLLYREVELTTVTRRSMQVQFLRKKVRGVKEAFNAAFEKIVKQKAADTDKVAELNGKVDDTIRELQKIGVAIADDKFWPTLAPYEHTDELFTVKPEEIKAPRYVSAAERKRLQEEEQAAEQRAKRSQADSGFERALKQMMGGTLVSKSQQADEFILTKPEWMNGNPKDFSEEQKKEYREFLAKEKQVAEEKAKRKATLETELKSLRAAVDDIVTKFDEAVAQLHQQWLQAQASICTTEMAIVHLGLGVDGAISLGSAEEKKLQAHVAGLKDKYAAASKAAGELRAQVEQQQEVVNLCSGEERQLDRLLKKDFCELECYNRLLQLYKFRTAKDQEHGETVDVLDQSMQPEGLEASWWERFQEFRAKKIQSEARLRDETARLALMRQELDVMEAEDTKLANAVGELMNQYTEFRNKRKQLMYDVDMQLNLKLGQVEAEPPELVSADMSHAMLLNRSLVESVNSVIKEKGASKVSILTAIKDFKKGIYMAEWENKRADMVVEDLVEKARELQLLRVTKELQQLLKQGEEKVSTQEIASLENLIKTREALHLKKVEDLKRKLKRIQDNIEAKKFQNMEATSHLTEVKQVLDDQSRLQQSLRSTDLQASRKMKSLVTNKKLKDIAKAQADEVALLSAELEKLQLRTFPSFYDANPRPLPPDTKYYALPNQTY